MTRMRSPDDVDAAAEATAPPAPQANLVGHAQVPLAEAGTPTTDREGDAPVVLWDELKAPETGEPKPVAKDLPPDPSVH